MVPVPVMSMVPVLVRVPLRYSLPLPLTVMVPALVTGPLRVPPDHSRSGKSRVTPPVPPSGAAA